MKPHQKKLVQETWSQVEPIADQAAALFYHRLFEIAPAVKPMFAKTDMKRQGQMLMQALSLTVKGLDEPAKLMPVLQKLGERHASYGVHDEHYDTVGEALLWTLGEGLGKSFTTPVKNAWATAYALVAGVMKDAAKKKAA
jgi:hemoglobin-like flavoprotein